MTHWGEISDFKKEKPDPKKQQEIPTMQNIQGGVDVQCKAYIYSPKKQTF